MYAAGSVRNSVDMEIRSTLICGTLGQITVPHSPNENHALQSLDMNEFQYFRGEVEHHMTIAP